ncbi:MAG: extracellular solute-binding protein [Bacilli bacterium]|jgi:iron(III) transport system substrate-binding protein|nr:extracellular solute-binding protein [Bacilli bacterium]
MGKSKNLLVLVLVLVLSIGGLFAAGSKETVKVVEQSAKRELLIYCPQARTDFADFVAGMAKEQLGIDIEWLKAGGGTVRDKVLEEKNNPQADIVLGLAQIMMEPLITADCLIPYTPTWADELDDMYIGTDGYYHMYWQTPIILVYNPAFVKGDMIPHSWEDLADPKYKNMFRYGKLTSQTTNVYTAALLSKYSDDAGNVSDEGWGILKSIFHNAAGVGYLDYNDFASGKHPISLDWYPNPVSMAETYGFNYEIVSPKDGSPMVSEGVALVKGTKHEDVAKEFIDWFGKTEVQKEICEFQSTISGIPSVIAVVNKDLADMANTFTKEKIQKIDWNLVGNNYQDWMTKVALW